VNDRIFISYAHQDARAAEVVRQALSDAGFRPWIDTREIRPGESFIAAMNEGVGSASYLLLLVSQATQLSEWVSREWMSALANRATVVIPVRLDDAPVPPLLRDILYFDLARDRGAGLQSIVDFFVGETKEVTPPMRSQTHWTLRTATRRQLRLIAIRCLDEAGLRSFCFDAEIAPGSLQGSGVHEQLVSLLHAVEAQGLLRHFADWLESEKGRCVKNSAGELRASSTWNWGIPPD
jgi:hypothetical protein